MRTSRSQRRNLVHRSRFLPAGIESLESRAVMTALPAGFSDHAVDDNLNAPTAMVRAPDGRIFVAEQGGALRIIKNGQLLPTPFTSINVDSRGERGLIGVTLDPNFATNQFVYVHYTVAGQSASNNRISRFTANGDLVSPLSERVILDLPNLSSATNHNGGAIQFGKDGKLYVAVGENANASNSQTLSNPFGKMLRINPDPNNLIPADNPFVGTPGAREEIWALGLRNPFKFAVHQKTGALFINDVGAGSWEEINRGIAGANYGWPSAEGPDNGNPNFVDPIFAYQHNTGTPQGRAITGGTFYDAANPNFPPAFADDYYFADLTGNFIWRYDPKTDVARSFARLAPTSSQPVDMFTAPNGDLYYLVRDGAGVNGEVRRIHYTSKPPQILNIGSAVTYAAGSSGVRLSSTVNVADPDSANFQAGRIRFTIVAGRGLNDQLFFRPSANFTIAGNRISYQGKLLASFSGGKGGNDLLISLNARATSAITRGLLRSVHFRSTVPNPSSVNRTIAIRMTDGDGAISARVNKVVRITGSQTATAANAALPALSFAVAGTNLRTTSVQESTANPATAGSVDPRSTLLAAPAKTSPAILAAAEELLDEFV